MSKKILLIQYFYKPFSSNQSFRYEQIIENYKKENVQIDILTSAHFSISEIEVFDFGTVYRVNSKFLKKKLNDNNENSSFKKKKSLIHFIRKKIYNIIWPDFACLWIYPAIKKGIELSRKEEYDLIISGSFPFSSHIVGYFLKRKYPTLKWVVDYIDPFSLIKNGENPSNNVKLYGKLNILAEKKVNEKADKIILLKEAVSSFEKVFPAMRNKVVIAPPMLGIDRHQYESTTAYEFDSTYVNIIFLGSLYKSIRNPKRTLEIFSDLCKENEKNRICLHFIGDTKDCEEILNEYIGLENLVVKLYGKVSKVDAMSYMKGADILLNISNDSTVQLPGKVVEYFP